MPYDAGSVVKPNVVNTAAGGKKGAQVGEGIAILEDEDNDLGRGSFETHDGACALLGWKLGMK